MSPTSAPAGRAIRTAPVSATLNMTLKARVSDGRMAHSAPDGRDIIVRRNGRCASPLEGRIWLRHQCEGGRSLGELDHGSALLSAEHPRRGAHDRDEEPEVALVG